MFTSFKGCIITSFGITFLTYSSLSCTPECTESVVEVPAPPQSQIPQTSPSPPCSNCSGSHSNNTEILEEFTDEFSSSDLYLELLEVPQIGPIITQEYLYNLLSSETI